MSESPRIRPMTADDFTALYGEPPRYTIIGWTAELRGAAAGVAGVAFVGETPILFANLTDALRPHRRFIRRAAAFLATQARKYGAVAVADPALPLAGKLLSHLGFDHIGRHPHGHGELYLCRRFSPQQ
jgi:hypothetical protein